MVDDIEIEENPDEQLSLAAQIPLWPEGPPGGLAGAEAEIRFSSPPMLGPETIMLRNVADPSVTVFAPSPANANGFGVIICPGGGWGVLAWEKEGVEPARWLAARGYTAFVLKYRVMVTPPDPEAFIEAVTKMAASNPLMQPGAKPPRVLGDAMPGPAVARAREIAAEDGRRALAIIRDRADEWGVRPDRIGMLGFSAGAFLVADVALEPGGAPLAFAAPIYGGETQGRSVPPDAPPLFTVVAQDDRAFFRIVEGLYADWTSAARPAEMHIFTRGGHGFGLSKRGLPVDRWTDLLGDWLADQGLA
jgi:acetyl esterase/lipase